MYVNVCLLKESLFQSLNSRLLGGSTFQINFKFDFGKTFTVESGLIEKFLGNHPQTPKNIIFFITKIIRVFCLFLLWFFFFFLLQTSAVKTHSMNAWSFSSTNKYFYIYAHINEPKIKNKIFKIHFFVYIHSKTKIAKTRLTWVICLHICFNGRDINFWNVSFLAA